MSVGRGPWACARHAPCHGFKIHAHAALGMRLESRTLYRFLLDLSYRRHSRSTASLGGFSLLELVVVVAILGILTAVSLPALLGNTERARMASAKVALQNAITECAVAKQDGRSEQELTFVGATTSTGKPGLMTADVIPSLFARPDGFRFDESKGGCSGMYLMPIGKDGNVAMREGYPILQAKLAARGRVVKAFQFCQATATVDLESDCNSWDSTGSVVVKDCSSAAKKNLCEKVNSMGNYSSARESLNDPHSSWPLLSDPGAATEGD